ncbi:MAG: hypothetical protein RRA51_04955 [Armatimonadota bacterium]|nr:hypothetical protein [Armatimonadota bacterium]
MGRYQGDPRTAEQIIADEKRASIKRKKDFPSELLDKTFDEIDRLAKQGSRRAKQMRKMLTDSRFDKQR